MAVDSTDPEIYRSLGLSEPEGWASVAASYGGGGEFAARATLLRAFADIAVATARNPMAALADTLGTDTADAAARFAERLDDEDRRTIAGGIAWSVLQDVCALLANATEPGTNPAEVSFAVFVQDDDENPGEKLQVMHEDWREVGATFLGATVVRA